MYRGALKSPYKRVYAQNTDMDKNAPNCVRWTCPYSCGGVYFGIMGTTNAITLHTQGDLEEIKRRVNTLMVDMVDRSVQSLDKAMRRLDEIDDAMAKLNDISKMTVNELVAYQAFMRESFRMKQDFLKTLSGYDINISKVPVAADSTTMMDEDAAVALREEVMRRDADGQV